MQYSIENVIPELQDSHILKALSFEEEDSLNRLFFQETVLNNLSPKEKESYIDLLLRQDSWVASMNSFYKAQKSQRHQPKGEIDMHVYNWDYLKEKLPKPLLPPMYLRLDDVEDPPDFVFWGIIILCIVLLNLLIFWM